jgi:magnesium transporter
MHPLPPPPTRSSDSQPVPPRPSASCIQNSTGQADQSRDPSSQGQVDPKRRRKHRGGRKGKRNRRQSFAAPSEGSEQPAISEMMSDQQASNGLTSGPRQSVYRLGQAGGDLSSTSLDSEALLDHRYMLTRSPTLIGPNLRFSCQITYHSSSETNP